jgi:hypothetical protein
MMSNRERSSWVLKSFLASILFSITIPNSEAIAFETDQFTPTPAPLVDLGNDLNDHILVYLNELIDKTNAKIDKHPNSAAKYLTESYITEHFNHSVCPFYRNLCEPETWALYSKNDSLLRHYKPPIEDSIYFGVFATIPFSFLFDSPSVNFFGIYLGTDKIGHFFEQGYAYYEIYTDAYNKGASDFEARQKAVDHGVLQENTYFGTMIDGVYSNGDLSADYAGMTFYMNFTHEVKIGDTTVPPILTIQGNHWALTPDRTARDHLINPFISEHLNEAFNPCKYTFNLATIREHVQEHCQDWIVSNHITKESETARLNKLKTWFGYEYGHSLPPDKEISFVTECFSSKEIDDTGTAKATPPKKINRSTATAPKTSH